MIFQSSLRLEVPHRDVYLVLDLETGLLGFTERIQGKDKEYTYQEAPVVFKQALVTRMEDLSGPQQRLNLKISRKRNL